MSLISAFRLFPHLSCQTPVYDRSGARSATIGRSFLKYIPPCPMHNVPCPMPNAQCTMSHVLFMTRFSLCHSFLRSVLSPVLHTVHRPLADPEREARLYTYPFEIRFSTMLWKCTHLPTALLNPCIANERIGSRSSESNKNARHTKSNDGSVF